MARVHARDEVGFIAQNLQCETRAHCLTLCASTRHVLLQICLRYALIYSVWNAVLLDARNSHTDRLSRELCVCLSCSSIEASVKCT